MTDPFYGVKDTVKTQTERVQVKYEKLLAMVRSPDSNSDFKESRKVLVKELRAVDKDIKELRKAVDMIDKNRQKFPHIKDAELNSRKQFVEESQRIVNEVKLGIESPAVRRRLEEEENKGKRETYEETTNALATNAVHQENSRFIKDQRQQVVEMHKMQDANLELLGKAVDNLGETGRVIKDELREQEELINGLSEDVDKASDKMSVVQAALTKLLNSKDGCQIWTIVILGLILILLVALVIWT
mmetsp:Transcript_23237/g.31819  ORF Transcript_23237/g.31819 Transcript_23237/m.31819 type:complete len:244 (+) Transcript_23237:44-775(+)